MTEPHRGFQAFGGQTVEERPQDWGTPWDLFRRWDARFHFTSDVCANEENAKVRPFISEAEDGLRVPWGPPGAVAWCNPPYGRDTPRWMRKAIEEARRGVTTAFLVFVRSDTAWWHEAVPLAAEVHLLRGRVRFVRPGGKGDVAPMPSCIIVFTPESVSMGTGPILFHEARRGTANEVIPDGEENTK